MTKENVQPIFIMSENASRTKGKDAQNLNIMAAKLVAETVRTTLGPKGMDKMIVDSMGDVTVTNDGVTILKEMNIEHPSAKMVVEIANTQEEEVGDGTTTAVVLAGELLKQAEDLLDQDIHPTVIAKGYRMAAVKAKEILNKIGTAITDKDTDILHKVAMTAMTGKGAEASKEHLANLVIQAVSKVGKNTMDGFTADMNDIKIETKVGSGVDHSELIQGIVLDKERTHPGMPMQVSNAKVALLDTALEVRSTETDAKISITDPAKLQAFLDMEDNMLRKMVDQVAKSGANVVFCQKGIDDNAQHFLAKQGIFAVRRVGKSDMEKLAKATSASIVSNLNDLKQSDLGKAGIVEEIRVGDEEMTYVKECKNAKSVTLLIRGSTEHVIDEIKRAIEDAIGDVIASLKQGKVVAGAGAPEIELAKGLAAYAETMSGREQFAVQAFAKAMEIIPRTLAENAGLDPIDVLTELRAAHDKGKKNAGIDVFSGKVVDSWKDGVIEPLKIKTQAVSSASEVATMILRIDDVIAGTGSSKDEMPPGMPPGMPGMGGY
ncbi:thermosome subunit alpha [Nanoarchaeota archaeon]